MAAAPTLETFCSRLPKSVPSELAMPPQVSSVDDGYGCAGQGLPPARSWIDLVGDVKYQWDTKNSVLFHVCL